MDDSTSADLEQLPMRSASDVARRCIVLSAVVAAGHKTSPNDLSRWLHQEGLWESVSPEEAAFFRASVPSREQMIKATWRVEALLPLVWALGKVRVLPPAKALCDIPLIRSALPDLFGPAADFVSGAVLRSQAELLDAQEETYQAHWAVRDAAINNRPVPNGYSPDILQERHLALNWLIFPDPDWDDVTTDT